jgi:hypothetical protein
MQKSGVTFENKVLLKIVVSKLIQPKKKEGEGK